MAFQPIPIYGACLCLAAGILISLCRLRSLRLIPSGRNDDYYAIYHEDVCSKAQPPHVPSGTW